jgi:hypothetical protein
VASVKAQVLIGGNGTTDTPHEGAILDLSKTTGKGLLLPKVNLGGLTDFSVADESLQSDGKGMMVYNTNEALPGGKGLYVWDGAKWNVATNINPAEYSQPDATHRPIITGISCFDVSEGKDNPGSQEYVVSETGTATITSIKWVVTPSSPDLLVSNAASGTLNAKQTLNFNDAETLRSAATGNAQAVTITAYIEYEDGRKVDVSKSLVIQLANCCADTYYPDAAYEGPEYLPLTGATPAATVYAMYTPAGGLCVKGQRSANWEWHYVRCYDVMRPPHDWRLANAAETLKIQSYKNADDSQLWSGTYTVTGNTIAIYGPGTGARPLGQDTGYKNTYCVKNM